MQDKEQLDKDIGRIQRSTKTKFKLFSRPHDWMRLRFKFYYKWSQKKYAVGVHVVALIVFILGSVVLVFNAYFAYSVIYKTREAIIKNEGKLDYKTSKEIISKFDSGPVTLEILVEDIDYIIQEINHYFGKDK